MLGNDVVDLEDVDARPETYRSRFDLRVFAEEERRAIAADPHPQARRWAHWGAKEAAYKLGRQIDPHFVFAPGRLVPRFGPRVASDSVECRRGRLALAIDPRKDALALELSSFEAPAFVHVVAQPAGGDWAGVVMAVAPLEASGEDPGRAVRRLAVREIARAIGVDAARLEVVRRGNGGDGRVPALALDGRALRGSLSLSHHGRFVAFAFREAFAADARSVCPDADENAPAPMPPVTGARAGRAEQSLFTERPAWAPGVPSPIGFVGDPVRRRATAWMTG